MRILISGLLILLLPGAAEAKQIKVSVKGMVCAFCAQGITKKFKALPATSSVDVSLEKKLVILNTVEGQDIDDKKIESILTESGYNVDKIDRSIK